MIVYGNEIAKDIKAEIAARIDSYVKEGKRRPRLEVVLVGDDPASLSYVKGKSKASEISGIDFKLHHLKDDIDQNTLEDTIAEIDKDETVDGILLQLPLPGHLDERRALAKISDAKDVDGLKLMNKGKLFIGEKGLRPCTPKGVMAILDHCRVPIEGARAVVIGRSQLVGLPLAKMLLDRNATVTICHSKTKDLKKVSKEADILIVAVGIPGLINREYIKDGAVVIDVGVNRVGGHLCGDVDFDDVKDQASIITPVPKGVGPMTIACLMQNTLEAYEEKI